MNRVSGKSGTSRLPPLQDDLALPVASTPAAAKTRPRERFAIPAFLPAALRELPLPAICTVTAKGMQNQRNPPLPIIWESLERWQRDAPDGERCGRKEAAARILAVCHCSEKELALQNLGLTALPSCLAAMHWIESLKVDGNQLSVLPPLPPRLRQLIASRNRLTGLSSGLPSSLTEIWIDQNGVRELPDALPPALQHLSIAENPVTHLPRLPSTLQRLSARGTLLANLPDLPGTLIRLDAGECCLTELPMLLPAGLKEIFVDDNNLMALPTLPRDLFRLQASGNQLTILPDLPLRLQVLSAARNRLARLPVLPDSLQELNAEDNYLTSLPVFPAALARIVVNDNRIEAVPFIHRDIRKLGLRSNPLSQTPSHIARLINRGANPLPALRALQHGVLPGIPRPVADNLVNNARANNVTWRFAETEANAWAFNVFQRRLTETAEYRNVSARPALVARFAKLVTTMRASAILRATCFDIANSSITRCGDRVALGLNQMELAEINHHAETGRYDDQELYAIGMNLFKLHTIDEIGIEKISELRSRGVRIDEVEIRLAYQTALKKKFGLSGMTEDMLSRACANLTNDEIEIAEKKARLLLETDASVEYMAQWLPWRQAMQRQHPAAYGVLSTQLQALRDALSIKPHEMLEQEWLTALAELATIEESKINALTHHFTARFSGNLKNNSNNSNKA